MTATPPALPGPQLAPVTRLQRVRPLLSLVAGALGGAALLAVRDPHAAGSYGFCPLLRFTGLFCPFCGSLRAVNDLTHGDAVAAVGSNALVVLALPVLAVVTVVALLRLWSQDARPAERPVGPLAGAVGAPPRWVGWTVLAMALAFTVLRNLPMGAVLAP